MRITNWRHFPWLVFVCLATIVAGLLYVGNFHPERMPAGIRLPPSLIQAPTEHHTVGGTPLGLAFGAISLGIFVFAALLSLRKRIPLWRIGTVQRWLRAHIWLTLLTVPLVLFHCGFRLGGPMTTLLMALYALVMVSGIYGLALQHLMPGLMKERLPTETVFEQIPYIRAQLCRAAEEMRDSFKSAPPREPDTEAVESTRGRLRGTIVQAKSVTAGIRSSANDGASLTQAESIETIGALALPADLAVPRDPSSEAALVELIDRQVLPYLEAGNGRKQRLGNARFSDDTFRFVKLRVAEVYRDRVEEIQAWCDERRMLDLQTRLQHWLHGWLFVHVPFSFLLLILTFWHAYVTLFYY